MEAQVAVLGVREVELGVERGAARLGRRQAARRGALAADHGVVGDHNAAGRLEILHDMIFISTANLILLRDPLTLLTVT